MSAALLGGVVALGVCAAVVFAGVLGGRDSGSPSTAGTKAVSEPATGSTGTTSLADLYDKVKDGVVYVQAGDASGSGFVIDDAGHIVTNDHVVEGSSSFQVRIGDKGPLIPAQLVGADASTDLALLKVDPAQAGTLHPLELADPGDVEVGDSVIAIGSPFGLQSTLTSGIVSALGRSIQSPNGQTISGAIQTDAAINPGNSGGPLIDAEGKVVGVNAQIASQSGGNTGVGFAISIATVKDTVPKLKAGGGTGGQSQQQQVDPYGQGQQVDPYGQGGEQVDPYGQGQQVDPYGQGGEQVDPYGQGEQDDPYGQGQQADPYGQGGEQVDPYGQGEQVDPYGQGQQADPYGYVIPGLG
ncbi:MAG: trypsin-like peptidase domain-containing protein [Solirubrobacterales bacterium]